ncbi:MAG: pyridoxamine 5'-phosphate oxidase family protein [Promethearchaeota archaeon]
MIESSDVQIKKLALELLETTRFAFLTTLDSENLPHTRAMFNLRDKMNFPEITNMFENSKPFMMYFSTNTSSFKFKHISNNPNVSVLISRTDDFLGLTLNEKIEIIEDPVIKEGLWFNGSEKYYRLGKEDPDYTILRLIPNRLEWWGAGFKGKLDLIS